MRLRYGLLDGFAAVLFFVIGALIAHGGVVLIHSRYDTLGLLVIFSSVGFFEVAREKTVKVYRRWRCRS